MEKAFLHETFNQAVKGKPGCLFCQPYEGMIMHETEHFRILIDTFPVADGHLMISSKDHYGSCGEIPSSLFSELDQLKNDLTKKMMSINNTYIYYEHGRAGCCLSKDPNQKCEHFHMHCLPVNVSIQKKLRQRFEEIQLKNFQEICPLFMEYNDYLFFEDTFGNQMFYPVGDKTVESHLLRTLVCRELDVLDLAKWEDFKDPELFLRSYDVVKDFYLLEKEEAVYDLLG